MKKILILFFCLISTSIYSFEKENTFTFENFDNAQKAGKTVVINSWNKSCSTCAKQVKILKNAEKDFKDVVFLSYEQTTNDDVAKFLKIDFWTTIVIYKNNKEISRLIGETDKDLIYSNIKEGT
tara:strand:- start:782 stop:1153 length:372 start_codon:yes stop_codon:yes gene_type:complete